MLKLTSPISDDDLKGLSVGDMFYLSGQILTGRDAALPRLVKILEENDGVYNKIDVKGKIIFHTGVSDAGVGPTSSNKVEIESSMEPLSKYGIKIHIGKGKISKETVQALKKYNAIFAIVPPVTALLGAKTKRKELIDFPELGMEGLHLLEVEDFPLIVGAINGRSIYD